MKTLEDAKAFAAHMSEMYGQKWVPFREAASDTNVMRGGPEYYACPEARVEEYKAEGCVFL